MIGTLEFHLDRILVSTTADGVITVTRSDTVAWQGSVAGPPGEYSGSVWVELPPPFGQIEIDSWSGESVTTSKSGVHEYDLPSVVLAGVEFVVGGEHTDANGGLAFVALDLVLFGVLPLNSSVVTLLPLLGPIAGGALGAIVVKRQGRPADTVPKPTE